MQCRRLDLIQTRPHAAAHIQQEHDGTWEPVMTAVVDLLLDPLFIDGEIRLLQAADGLPGSLAQYFCLKHYQLRVEPNDIVRLFWRRILRASQRDCEQEKQYRL